MDIDHRPVLAGNSMGALPLSAMAPKHMQLLYFFKVPIVELGFFSDIAKVVQQGKNLFALWCVVVLNGNASELKTVTTFGIDAQIIDNGGGSPSFEQVNE